MSNETPSGRAISRDGAEIAYFTSGKGPPLVVVHGAPADHTRWRPLLPFLEPHVTVHAIDRRGRGASTDGPDYDIAREHEDIAAVVDEVAEASGSPVSVYGHSYGGFVAFGAATLTSNLHKLVLYEGWPVPDPSVFALPPETEEQMDALLAEDDRDGLLEKVWGAELSTEDFQALRALPSWAGRVAAAHTFPREIRACATALLDPAQAAQIKIPTLLLTGEESTDPNKAAIDAVAAAIPDSRIVVIDGQQHVADVMVPDVFAGHVLAFLRG